MSMYKKICITNRHLVTGDYTEQIEKVLKTGVDVVILREKDLTETEYEELAVKVIDLCSRYGVVCMLHSFFGVALKLGHPYIHVTMEQARSLDVSDFIEVGVSTHSVDEAVEAVRLGATYITASHIFETKCKEGLRPRGIRYLTEVTEAVSIPVYALGGIIQSNVSDCIRAGAAGVCMMSEYMKM